MPRHHAPHAPNVGPILFVHNENIAHIMPCVTARAVTSCARCTAHARRQAGRPNYTWRARNYLWMPNMGPILFAHNENIAHVMPCVTARAVTSCVRRTHAGKPAALIISGAPGITYGHTVCASRTTFIKNNRLTFYCPKYENRKPERAAKDSHCHAQ